MQITERSLSCHGEALPKGIYARRQERNLILAHLSFIYNMLLYRNVAAKILIFSNQQNIIALFSTIFFAIQEFIRIFAAKYAERIPP